VTITFSKIDVTEGSTLGKHMDSATLVSTITGTPNVERQIIAVGSPDTFGNVQQVDSSGRASVVTTDLDTAVQGTISATDALGGTPALAGALISTAPTANSFVALATPEGDAAWAILLTGTFGSGTVWFEASLDSTNGSDGNWIPVGGKMQGFVNPQAAFDYNGNAPGMWRGTIGGYSYIRARIVGATAPSVTVKIRLSGGVAMTQVLGTVREERGSTPTKGSTASSVTSATLVPALVGRHGCTIRNDPGSTAGGTLYVDPTGGTATAATAPVAIPPNGYWEMPQPGFENAISVIWSAASVGNALWSQW
jgi:hypothetical protein